MNIALNIAFMNENDVSLKKMDSTLRSRICSHGDRIVLVIPVFCNSLVWHIDGNRSVYSGSVNVVSQVVNTYGKDINDYDNGSGGGRRIFLDKPAA
jgi:hypothetical protein